MSALCLEPGRRCRLSAPPEDVCDFRKPYVRRLGRARYLLRGPRRARPGDREATHMTLSTTRASDCLGARLKSTRSLAGSGVQSIGGGMVILISQNQLQTTTGL